MSKSLLYANNSINQTTSASGTVVNFGNVVRRYGNNIKMSGGNAVTSGQGYYLIDTNLNFTPSATATISVSLYSNGTLLTGATAEVNATADEAIAISIPTVDRSTCCVEKTITAVVDGAGTLSNASIVVVKE